MLTKYTVIDMETGNESEVNVHSAARAAEVWASNNENGEDWTEVPVVVIAPDGTATEHLVSIEYVEPDIDVTEGTPCEDPRIAKREEEDRLAAMTEPPEEAWIVVGAHRWATDGSLAVREDGPRPATMRTAAFRYSGRNPGAWLGTSDAGRPKPAPDALGQLLKSESSRAVRDDTGAKFDPRMAPLLKAGNALGSGPLSPHVVWRDGEVVALLMPVRADEATGLLVDVRGEPC